MSCAIFQDMGDEDVVAMAQSGSSAATEHILERYSRLVGWVASGLFLPGGERSDVIQEGKIGLFKAVRDHCPGMPFRPFAVLCIRRQIRTTQITSNRQKQGVLNSAIPIDGLRDFHELSVDARSPEQIVIDRHSTIDLLETLRTELSPLEWGVIVHRLNGDAFLTIADRLGRNFKCVDNAIARSRRRVMDMRAKGAR